VTIVTRCTAWHKGSFAVARASEKRYNRLRCDSASRAGIARNDLPRSALRAAKRRFTLRSTANFAASNGSALGPLDCSRSRSIGVIYMSDNSRSMCTHCHGRGVWVGKPCPKCGGKGFFLLIADDDDDNRAARARLDKPQRRRPPR
jgi:hypothetical protein